MALQRSQWLRFGLFLLLVGAAVYYVSYSMPRFLRSRETAAAVPVYADSAMQMAETGELTGPAEPAAARNAAFPERDFFAEFRVDRERARGQQREMLQELIQRPDLSPEARRTANAEYLALSRVGGLEVQVEGLIKARGFDDAVVYLGEQGAQVVVRARELDAVRAAQVADLVSQTAGVKAHQVRIVAHP